MWSPEGTIAHRLDKDLHQGEVEIEENRDLEWPCHILADSDGRHEWTGTGW